MTIPSDFLPVEGQTGLYYKDRSYVINGESFTARELRADDNHCFYDIKDPEEEMNRLQEQKQSNYDLYQFAGQGYLNE